MGSQRVRYDLVTKQQQQQKWLSSHTELSGHTALSGHTGLLASPGQDPVPHPQPHPMPVLGQAHVRFAINNSTNTNKPAFPKCILRKAVLDLLVTACFGAGILAHETLRS